VKLLLKPYRQRKFCQSAGSKRDPKSSLWAKL